jgi:hypothetical protein
MATDSGGMTPKAVFPDPVTRWWPVLREVVLFGFGLYGVHYEAVVQQAERPLFLAVYTAMMGLPALAPLFKAKGGG